MCFLSLLFMKKRIYLLLFFIPFLIFSQEKYSKEIQLISDNDLYVSTSRDRYYTNGLFFKYNYLSKKVTEKVEKRIFEWEIGQQMYTPNRPTVERVELHDRPFAAYLYGSFGVTRVYKKNRLLKTTIQIGTIGPNAFGKEVQDLIHDIYGYKEATGWSYQVANAFGLNFNAEYIHFITKSNTNGFDLSWASKGKIGTIFTDISSGVVARFGFKPLANFTNSIAFGTHLNNEKTNYIRQIESFLFIKPMFRYAFYDATLEGSFLNDNSTVTKELIPFVFDVAIGIQCTANRFNFGYTFNYNTSKSEGLRYTYGNKYGTISFSYLLH